MRLLSCVICLVALVCSPLCVQAVEESAENSTSVVRLQDTGAALLNPQMGWTMHFYSNVPKNYGSQMEPSDSLDWFEGCSTVYLRLPWCYMEPEEGEFNWAILDTPAQRFIAVGKKVAFRFTTSENWIQYATPKWVFDAGAKGVWYTWGTGPDPAGNRIDPVFTDSVYLEKLRNFLLAAGKRYNKNPDIAFIDVGTVGMWGEGHTGGSSKLTEEQTADAVRKHIDLHLEAFPDVLLCISDDVDGPSNQTGTYPITDEARSRGVSLRDDSILVQREPHHWYHADMAERFWRTMPVILEHEHLGSSIKRRAWNEELLEKSVEDYHASYMSIHWWPNEEWEKCQATIQRINRRLGYRICLQEIELPQVATIGEPFSVRTVWRNAGVAPCYPGGFFSLTFKDENGGIVAVLADESLDMRTLPVGAIDSPQDITHTSLFRAGHIAPVTRAGTYSVYVSVGRRDGTPDLELPHTNGDNQKRYLVGTIELREK